MAETYLQHHARQDVLDLERLARWHASTCSAALGDPCVLSDAERRWIAGSEVAYVRTAVAKAFTGELRANYLARVEAAAATLLAHPTTADLH